MIAFIRQSDGQTPLHLAAALGDEALVKFFFLCKANPNITDKEGSTLSVSDINVHVNAQVIFTPTSFICTQIALRSTSLLNMVTQRLSRH